MLGSYKDVCYGCCMVKMHVQGSWDGLGCVCVYVESLCGYMMSRAWVCMRAWAHVVRLGVDMGENLKV